MIMTITEYITFGFAFYLMYVSLLALHWQSESTIFEALGDKKAEIMNAHLQTKFLVAAIWGFGYIGTNIIFNLSVQTGESNLANQVEMMWLIAHLVVTFSMIRDAQVSLIMEKCQRRAFVFWYNPIKKTFI